MNFSVLFRHLERSDGKQVEYELYNSSSVSSHEELGKSRNILLACCRVLCTATEKLKSNISAEKNVYDKVERTVILYERTFRGLDIFCMYIAR